MESLTSISPSIILPPATTTTIPVSTSRSVLIRLPSRRSSYLFGLSSSGRRISISRRRHFVSCKSTGGGGGGSDKLGGDEEESEEVEKALHLDGTIPGTSDEFVRQVSSRAYDMRRKLEQTFDSTSYDEFLKDCLGSLGTVFPRRRVLQLNYDEENCSFLDSTLTCWSPTHGEEIRSLFSFLLPMTLAILINSEVEKELGLLFPSRISNQTKQARPKTKFDMLVEDIRDGVLVFEDVNEAVRYCDLLQGGGKGCEGVAEIEASSVFDLCRKTRSLAVLFRRGRTPPTPQTLERNLGSRKRSLEDLRDNK
ncbi:plant/protein [Arabidopsis thaliana]|uniref:Plant/protein n=1 Tax=Arabidopsis thaliana TaxID=3702 RepID=F4HSN5_ARATH|nr:plant/protein [Arabidopsis thaliana]AEE29096.1 plant/protein [Arabidopsis thaliana]|eukprot:NP_001154335.1 plant/protein [Arabidopsis thaliana]